MTDNHIPVHCINACPQHIRFHGSPDVVERQPVFDFSAVWNLRVDDSGSEAPFYPAFGDRVASVGEDIIMVEGTWLNDLFTGCPKVPMQISSSSREHGCSLLGVNLHHVPLWTITSHLGVGLAPTYYVSFCVIK
jgi:hypothetical protein